MPYTCAEMQSMTSPDDNADDDEEEGDFDVPDYQSPLQPDTDAWFDDLYEHYAAHGQECSSPVYKTAGELVGTLFVARDINAIAEALGEDGFIRYAGKSYLKDRSTC